MKPEGQLAMDETVIENEELEEALEKRYSAHEVLAIHRQTYEARDREAKALVERVLDIGVIARVGRFRVERREVEGRHVEFDTQPTTQTKIEADE